MDYPSWWESPIGEKKHFVVGPAPEGWVRCKGHYDFETGAWVDDEKPAKAEKKPAKAKKPRKAKAKAKDTAWAPSWIKK